MYRFNENEGGDRKLEAVPRLHKSSIVFSVVVVVAEEELSHEMGVDSEEE